MPSTDIEAVLLDCWYTLFKLREDVDAPRYVLAKGIADSAGYSYADKYDAMVVLDENLPESSGVSSFLKAYEQQFMLEPVTGYEEPVRKLAEVFGVQLSEAETREIASGIERTNEPEVLESFPSAIPVLETLRETELRIGLVTNTESLGLNALDEKFSFDRYFDAVVTSYDVGAIKPDAEMFEYALKELEVVADKTIMVGDSMEDDVKAAEDYGLSQGILVDRKNRHPEYSPRITGLEQVMDYLSSVNGNK